MEKFRSRCHFSIIFQSIWQFWAVILIFLLQQLDSLVELFRDFDFSEVPKDGLLALGGLILISAVIFIWQFLRWKKTWIILNDNLIILERKTLNKVKKTIALETVSTVNIEQNLFDRIVGTCRIKIDTNSMTTANETDINILLKKDKATLFKNLVMELIDQPKAQTAGPHPVQEEKKVYSASATDLFLHWVYTIPITSLLIVIGCIAFAIFYIGANSVEVLLLEIFGSFLAAALIFIGALVNVIKQFVNYYNFTIYRDGDDIHIKHGLIKLREYTVPVNKINAITIDQAPVARLLGKYAVKVSTVGIGDNKNENAYLSMAMSKEQMVLQMNEILPEYSFEHMLNVNPEEKVGMKVRLLQSIKWHILLLGIATVLYLGDLPIWVSLIPVGLDVFINLLYILSHKAAGFNFTDSGVILAFGFFGRHFTLCNYGKMEYIQLDQHPAARINGVYRGMLHMLNHPVDLPYVKREVAETIYQNMIKTKRIV